MAHVKGTTNWRNSSCGGKQSFLPPKSPFPSMPPAYADYGANPCIGSKGIPKPRDGQRHHQRTSSESFIIEEQPSWLDDLLNEPETPVRRGAHRRSSSDSFAYMDMSNVASNRESSMFEDYKHRNIPSVPSWGSHEFEYCKDVQYPSYYADGNSYGRIQSRGRETTLTSGTYPNNIQSMRDKFSHQNIGSSGSMSDPDAGASTGSEKQDQEDNASYDSKTLSERKDGPHPKISQPDTDQKRVKQQFAQRSRVRKLQYIAELERNVQALQAEGSEVSAELQFLDQQNLILSLENKALKQRLDSLAQEQLLKRLQQEMLEREIARLRALCQQHQQQQPLPAATHGRSNSRDLDSQFANLSLKPKDANSGRDTATGPFRI